MALILYCSHWKSSPCVQSPSCSLWMLSIDKNTIQLLLNAGACPFATDEDGQSPLYYISLATWDCCPVAVECWCSSGSSQRGRRNTIEEIETPSAGTRPKESFWPLLGFSLQYLLFSAVLLCPSHQPKWNSVSKPSSRFEDFRCLTLTQLRRYMLIVHMKLV